jgi:hypothetical protein
MWRDTGLRYTPKRSAKVAFKSADANIFSKENQSTPAAQLWEILSLG